MGLVSDLNLFEEPAKELLRPVQAIESIDILLKLRTTGCDPRKGLGMSLQIMIEISGGQTT